MSTNVYVCLWIVHETSIQIRCNCCSDWLSMEMNRWLPTRVPILLNTIGHRSYTKPTDELCKFVRVYKRVWLLRITRPENRLNYVILNLRLDIIYREWFLNRTSKNKSWSADLRKNTKHTCTYDNIYENNPRKFSLFNKTSKYFSIPSWK